MATSAEITDPAMELIRMCQWISGLQKQLNVQKSNAHAADVFKEFFVSHRGGSVHPYTILRLANKRFEEYISLANSEPIKELGWVDHIMISTACSAARSLSAPLQMGKGREGWSHTSVQLVEPAHLASVRGLSPPMRSLYPQVRLSPDLTKNIEEALLAIDLSKFEDGSELPSVIGAVLKEAISDLGLALRFPEVVGPSGLDTALARLTLQHTTAKSISKAYRAGLGLAVGAVLGAAYNVFLDLPKIDASAKVAISWYHGIEDLANGVLLLEPPNTREPKASSEARPKRTPARKRSKPNGSI